MGRMKYGSLLGHLEHHGVRRALEALFKREEANTLRRALRRMPTRRLLRRLARALARE
jgi:hypothetical protein